MKIRLWGTRGSIACAGPSTVRYGGDTACVEVRDEDDNLLILDAGGGIRALGINAAGHRRYDVLLTHLHMDHIQGLPFFPPLLNPDCEVHLWGPISTTSTLRDRLSRYLSPPLFPVRVRDLSNVFFHDVPPGEFAIGAFRIGADLVIHPGATLGFRIEVDGKSMAYLPDHEPALGAKVFPEEPEWTSGYELCQNVDVLIHDSQYTNAEYDERVGWGHTSTSQLVKFADLCHPKTLVTFHHDPSHDDEALDIMHAEIESATPCELIPGTEKLELSL